MADGARFCPRCGRGVAGGAPDAPESRSASPTASPVRKKALVPAVVAGALLVVLIGAGVAFGTGIVKAPWAQDDPLIGSWTMSSDGQSVTLDVKPDGSLALSTKLFVEGGKLLGMPATIEDFENIVSDISWKYVGDEGDCRVYELAYTGSGIEVGGVNYGDLGLSQAVLELLVPKSLGNLEAAGTWGFELRGLDSMGVLARAATGGDIPSAVGGTCLLRGDGACELSVQVDGVLQGTDSDTFTWVLTGTKDRPGIEVTSRYNSIPLEIDFSPRAA